MTKTNAKPIHWVLVDHLCRSCGGRVLRSVANVGMSPGGNPIYRCADCGTSSTEFGGKDVCWCGFKHRGQADSAYCCLPFSVLERQPFLRQVFLECGCDPNRGDVGIVLEESYRNALRLAELNGGQTLKSADEVAGDLLFGFKGTEDERKFLVYKISAAISAARRGTL